MLHTSYTFAILYAQVSFGLSLCHVWGSSVQFSSNAIWKLFNSICFHFPAHWFSMGNLVFKTTLTLLPPLVIVEANSICH